MKKQSNPQTKMLVLVLGLATWFAVPMAAMAENLPDYNSAAGMLEICKAPERPDAKIFHIAYPLKGADPTTRPVTFAFNGGSGASSIYTHLAATWAATSSICAPRAGPNAQPMSGAFSKPRPESLETAVADLLKKPGEPSQPGEPSIHLSQPIA
jgi:hypothetical protein